MTERGGVLLRFPGRRADEASPAAWALAFVPAEGAARLAALTSLLSVPGARPPVVGIALAEGAVVTVLDLRGSTAGTPERLPDDDWPLPGADRAVVCRLGGLDVAVTGGTVLATGLFDAAPGGDGVLWRGQDVPVLDVRALYARAEAALWAPHVAGGTGPPRVAEAPHEGDERMTWLPGEPVDAGAARGPDTMGGAR